MTAKTHKARNRRRKCEKKRKYKTWLGAMAAALMPDNAGFEPYECSICGFYHLTKKGNNHA